MARLGSTLERMTGYLTIAVLAILLVLAVLPFTRSLAAVTLIVPTVIAGGIFLVSSLESGHINTVELIKFAVLWLYLAVVSLTFTALGRALKWRYFLRQNVAQ